MKTGIPMIFFHLGDSYYLQYTLNQILHSNPTSEIYLIGDEKNKHYETIGIKHIDASTCEDTAKKFEKIYVHLSSMGGFVERICFQRWMYIRDFVINQHIEGRFCCLDSDVLVYGDITAYSNEYCPESEITVHGKFGPGCNIFKNVDILSKLVDNTFKYYSTPELLKELTEIYHIQHRNVTDMEMIDRFINECGVESYDLLKIVDGKTFDSHIAKITDDRFVKEKNFKKVVLKDGKAYCTLKKDGSQIQMYLLHMQGFYKVYMYKYYTGDQRKVQSLTKAIGYKNYMLLRRYLSNLKNGGVEYKKFKAQNLAKIIAKRAGIFKVSKLKRYAGKTMMSSEEANSWIKEKISQNEVFAAVRFGSSELATSVDALDMDRARIGEVRDKCMLSLCRNAGFFPNDKSLAYKYGKMQLRMEKNATLFAVWGMNMEDYVISVYGNPDARICVPRGFEPYYFTDPWSAALKGKRVLVIHPFEDTIKRQYAKILTFCRSLHC